MTTAADPRYLTDLMDLLSPRGLGKTSKIGSDLKNVPIDELVRIHLIDKYETFVKLRGLIKDHFTKPAATAAPADDEGLSKIFHGVSSKAGVISGKKPFEDGAYWVQNCPNTTAPPAPGDARGGSFVWKLIFGNTFDNTVKCNVCAFVTTDSFLSPAAASTEDVEMFLNYTPTIVASQMVPYLEVEFVSNKSHNNDATFNHLSTPSLLRFLLGSVQWFDKSSNGITPQFGAADSSLVVIKKGGFNKKGEAVSGVVSGMELFLSPQSLTNIETTKSSPTRLMDVMPFKPFASINNFEVTIANAGAGAMSHKTAKLALTIHDKARIAEMSEFFRGPVGYGETKIWTSYGWLAPRRSDSESDAYAKFINENMHSEDCWQVVNTQFSFDQAGKVVLTLSLVGFGVSKIRTTAITISHDYQKLLNGVNKLLEEIQDLSVKIRNLPFGPDARIVQVLNAVTSGAALPSDLKPENLNDFLIGVTSYAKEAGLSKEDAEKLVNKLRTAINPKGAKLLLAKKRADSLRELFSKIGKSGHDPFLAGPTNSNNHPPKDKYFNPDIIAEINHFYAPSPATLAKKAPGKQEPPAAGAEIPRETINIEADNKVMSFGKLFCSLALPAILEANASLKADPTAEVQVIFYALNDACGPISGQSIAEFPIDVVRLAYALDDTIKTKSKTSDLTVEEFLKVVINNQFADDRSIGYGMLSKNLFEPFDKDKQGPAKAEQNKEYESKMAQWQSRNPSFAKPIVEMVIETSKVEKNTVTRMGQIQNQNRQESTEPYIMRIHIYDKQNNPRKQLTNIVSMSGKLFVGSFQTDALKKKTKEDVDKLIERAKSKSNGDTDEKIAKDAGISLKGPGDGGVSIPIDAKLFGPTGIRANVQMMAPTLLIGSNGTLIKTANLQSKTDDLMAAANLVNIMKPKASESASPAGGETGLEGPGGLPLRTVPASLSMTTMGCPTVRLYQQYFVDLGTGTSLDNLYTCTQITHKIDPGKFETSMTFAFSDGYGKYSAPPTLATILLNQGKKLKRAEEAAAAVTAPTPTKKPGKAKPGGAEPAPPDAKIDPVDSPPPPAETPGTHPQAT